MDADLKRERQRVYARKWRRNFPDRQKAINRRQYLMKRADRIERARQWALANPAKYKHYQAISHLRCRYGLTWEAFQQALAIQHNQCAICLAPLKLTDNLYNNRYVVIDHDHTTGRFRGILCRKCNTGIGYIEGPGWIEKAMEYLAKES